MINDELELDVLKQTTQDLLDEDSMEIVLSRSEWERTPAGGMRKKNPQDLDPQTFYFAATSGDPRYLTTDTGDQVVASHVIIGLPGVDMQEKDEFKIGTRKFEIRELHPDRSYQVKGWVIERA